MSAIRPLLSTVKDRTPVYQDEAGKGLMTSAVTPIYGEYGNFLGVAGIDITLDRMIKENYRV